MNPIAQHAEELVEDAFNNVEGFPPTRSDIDRYVRESIGGMAKLAGEAVQELQKGGYYWASFDTRGMSSLGELVQLAWHEAIEAEATAFIEAKMEEIHEQVVAWEIVLDGFEGLAVRFTAPDHDDYLALSDIATKLCTLANATEAYSDAPENQRVSAEIQMKACQVEGIALPTGMDTADWEQFAKLLFDLSDVVDNYAIDFGGDTLKMQRQHAWDTLYNQTGKLHANLPLEWDNTSELMALRSRLRQYISNLNTYIENYS